MKTESAIRDKLMGIQSQLDALKIHFETKEKKEKAEKRSQKYLPGNIKAEDLHDGIFLFNEEMRKEFKEYVEKIQAQQKRYRGVHRDPSSPYGKFIYINQNYQIFSGNTNTYLGQGQNGVVYAVQNVLTGQWYCMKVCKNFRTNERDVLSEEGMLLSFEKGKEEYIVICELIQGKNLKKIMGDITQKKILLYQQSQTTYDKKQVVQRTLVEIFSFEQAIAMIISVAEAHESLHRKGYVHRDIKPENTMLQKKCVAIDFGFIKKAGEVSSCAGSPMYMPPEIFYRKSPHFKDDIYAMGITASEILALAIDNLDLYEQKDLYDDYQKMSMDTLLSTKERYNYLKETCKLVYPEQSEIETFIRFYLKSFVVIFGAKDPEYQLHRRLSAQAIALCQLIYQMTEPLEKRPDLSAVLQEMRKIRLVHINEKMQDFVDSEKNNYNQLLNELYNSRKKLNNTPYVLDGLEIFLLRSVDTNEKNRPTVEELTQYRDQLNDMLGLKEKVNKEIREYYSKKTDNTGVLAKKSKVIEEKPDSEFKKNYF